MDEKFYDPFLQIQWLKESKDIFGNNSVEDTEDTLETAMIIFFKHFLDFLKTTKNTLTSDDTEDFRKGNWYIIADQPRVLVHGCFDGLRIIYLVLILVFLSWFLLCFIFNCCLQLNVGLGPSALKLFEETPLHSGVLVRLHRRKFSKQSK